ncbi:hypothetical protein [Deinococcus gobiensis]|uniref:Uncharacterized protein n=1 Tax=Deinococcus gobiensis (strain DSM 21396 / JCM 16679 / CGMCC 1.7299 / I-0) TaxID=745776 RepID=H8GX79_DEIGI|nr:hypothetical protein [Deinococcus gobiensis]AFD25808.1 hypothetical protein DGo_CA1881 [Deinococcus gobiensis I-0]
MLNDVAQPAAAPARPAPQARKAAPFPKGSAPRAATRWCDGCGADQAFLIPDHAGHYECVTCATQRLHHELAEAQLIEALSPIIGIWVAQWRAAGMPLEEIDEVVKHCTGADMNDEYQDRHRLNHLRRLGMVYREAAAPPEPDPARIIANPAELPLIERRHADVGPLGRTAFFTAGDKEQVHVMPGVGAVILTLEGGTRAVIYMENKYQAGFRCPPELWPTVAAHLKYLPEGAA